MIFQYFDMIFCSRNDIPIIDRVFKLLSGICFCRCSVVNKIIDRVFKLLSGCITVVASAPTSVVKFDWL